MLVAPGTPCPDNRVRVTLHSFGMYLVRTLGKLGAVGWQHAMGPAYYVCVLDRVTVKLGAHGEPWALDVPVAVG